MSALTLYPTVRGKIVLFLFIGLFIFGLYNIVSSYALEGNATSSANTQTAQSPYDLVIIQLLSQVGPITASILGIGFSYLRKHGIKISAESEKVFTNSISSLTARESKWIYEEIRDNKATWVKKDQDEYKITEERNFPKSLGVEAKSRIFNHLSSMLTSKEFTGSAKKILAKNLPEMIEVAVAKNNKELTERSRKLISELAPLAIDSLLLLHDRDNAKQKTNKIIEDAMKAIQNNFDFEEIQFDKNFAEMFVRAELNKKIGDVA